ncbi:MAG: cation-translocating P-type ATPase [Lachnospiraceae bacterium]
MLTTKQAKENQEKYGFNELSEGKRKPGWLIFLEQFKDFLVIVLCVAAIVSGFLGDYESTIVILVVITMNAILGTVQTIKAENSLNALKKMSAVEAKVIRDGVLITIPTREVTVGDEVVLEAGECIPADGKLIECASLKTDESALTGESLPVEKSLDPVAEDAPLGDQTNRVFSGSFVTYGRARYEVTSIGMNTEVGKIATLLKKAEDKKTPLQMNLDDFGKKLTILILIFCGILFGISVIRGDDVADAFLFAVALAVAAIPEALSSIVTIVLSFGTQKMAKEHAIVRKLQAVEGLGSVSIICSDKTGTLTQNKMTVEDYYVDGKRIKAEDIDIVNEENQRFLMLSSVLCNDASVYTKDSDEGTDDGGENKEIGDPTETALIFLADKLGAEWAKMRITHERVGEIPFDSDRKLMTTVNKMEDGVKMIVKGAVDVLSTRIKYIRIGTEVREITEEDKKEIARQNMEFSKDGLRVLAFTYKEWEKSTEGPVEVTLDDENDLVFLGLIAMMDPPRPESKDAVAKCIEAGIKPIMITGDHVVTASAIAKRIGILKDESEACEGAVIEGMTDEELEKFVEGISVYARVSPEHKIRIVRAWQNKGNIVSMTGDGVNDAPALKQADIGVAMGITGTEVAKDAASMVLTDDNFATIVKAVENGRNIYKNIKSSIQFLLSGNFGAILVVLFASIFSLPVPFAPVHLLFINLLTDSLPAIALGLEPHSRDVMKEKPRPAGESILTKNYLTTIGIEGLCIGATTMAAFLIGYNVIGEKDALLGSTMAFGALCVGRLVHGFNCKGAKPVIFKKQMFNNKYLIGAFILGLALITAVLTIPALDGIFKVKTLGIKELLIVYGFALTDLIVIQILKAIRTKVKK